MSSFPAFNHYALTVSNLQRSIKWYERLFGSPPVAVNDADNYRAAMWFEPMFAIHENQHQLEGDVFDEFRIGLDHIPFGCASREELESWPARLDALGIEHGEILDRSYGAGLAFRDPDNIQLEFFLPMGSSVAGSPVRRLAPLSVCFRLSRTSGAPTQSWIPGG